MRTYKPGSSILLLSSLCLSAPCFATYGKGSPDNNVDVLNEQHQGQEQFQDQEQTQIQDQSLSNEQSLSAEGNSSSTINNNSRSTFAASGASSGRSTSTCQKVRDFRGADGWLFGIRWDVTDRECRRLNVADTEYERGNVYFSNTLTCSVKTIYSAFGSPDECKTAFNTDAEINNLKERNQILENQLLQSAKKCDSRIERCLSTVQK